MNTISYLRTNPGAPASGDFYIAKANKDSGIWNLVICDKTGSMPAVDPSGKDYSSLIGKNISLLGTARDGVFHIDSTAKETKESDKMDSINIFEVVKDEAPEPEPVKKKKTEMPKDVAADLKPAKDNSLVDNIASIMASLNEKELRKWLMFIYEGLLAERHGNLSTTEIFNIITILTKGDKKIC